MKINEIKDLINFFAQSNLGELHLEQEGMVLTLKGKSTVVTNGDFAQSNLQNSLASTQNTEQTLAVAQNFTNTQIEQNKEEAEEKNFTAVQSPLVGTFYRASAPTEKPFIEVGARVEKGQVLCVIEAMKMINEVTAPVSGTIRAIKAENDSLVAFGQTLVEITED